MDIIWNVFIEKGISATDLESLKYLALILLMLPIVATVIGIARYIIGLRSLSFYVPLLLTFIFFDIEYSNKSNPNFFAGLIYGIISFCVVLFSSALFYAILRRLRMHYIPKLSLIIIAATLATTILIFVSMYFDKSTFIVISPLSMIILVTTADGFMNVYAKKNFRYALSIAFETLIICVISYLIISIRELQDFVLTNPLLVIGVLIIINIYVGRFLGLRITEYWRFKSILLQEENTQDEQSSTNTTK